MAELLRLDLAGLPRWQRLTDDMRGRATNLAPVFSAIHGPWMQEETQQFLSQGAFFLGEQWEALNPQYAERKLKKWGPPPTPLGILYASGALFESLTNEGSPEHIKIITAQSAVFGSSVEYGKYHDTGATLKGGGTLPKRQIIKLRERFRRFVFRMTIKYLLTGKADVDNAG